MGKQRSFNSDVKRQVVEEFLSEVSAPAQIVRKYEISSGYVSKKEQDKRNSFRTAENDRKISGIVADVMKELRAHHLSVQTGK
jgi:hypothetical protein